MIPTLIAASMSVLPYAPSSLIFQSSDEVKKACAQFANTAGTDLNQFVQLSQNGNYEAAYQIWSDLLFRYFSFRLELDRTQGLSLSDQVKTSVDTEASELQKTFQQTLLNHPDLLTTFLQNAEASSRLTAQQRFFTVNILKEYQNMNLTESSKIAEVLQKLSAEKTESFCRSYGLAVPINSDNLSTVKVLSANIICFPGTLSYTYGGICPWKERIDQLAHTILNTNAEMVCLQEVWDPESMRALTERLKKAYAFFIYDAGDPAGTLQLKKMGYNSGLFIASKLPLDSVAFQRFPRSIPRGSNRGALIVTTSVAKQHLVLMNTHLQHGNTLEMRQVRQEQLFLCYASLQEVIARTLSNSWGCLVGDLNINAFTSELSESGLSRLFSIPYINDLSPQKATCTDYFNDLVLTPLDKRSEVQVSYELLDYCITPHLSIPVNSEQTLIPLYEITEPTKALSDHQGLLTTWTLISPTVEKSEAK